MKSRLEATERILKLRKEQDLQLRDSIFMATREVRIVVSMGAKFLFSPCVLTSLAGTASIGRICRATTTARPSTRLQ
jgi:hypothetical protein